MQGQFFLVLLINYFNLHHAWGRLQTVTYACTATQSLLTYGWNLILYWAWSDIVNQEVFTGKHAPVLLWIGQQPITRHAYIASAVYSYYYAKISYREVYQQGV